MWFLGELKTGILGEESLGARMRIESATHWSEASASPLRHPCSPKTTVSVSFLNLVTGTPFSNTLLHCLNHKNRRKSAHKSKLQIAHRPNVFDHVYLVQITKISSFLQKKAYRNVRRYDSIHLESI